MAQADDEEWEYIYDPTETETITFTIDFSASAAGPSGPISEPAKPSAQDPDDVNPDVIAVGHPEPQIVSKAKPPSSIQFLDLSSKSPYISYQGQVFSGSWGDTLGSDLVFASTADIPFDAEPVIQGRDGKWCLLGVSQITLVAKPVELIKRSRLELQSPDVAAASTSSEIDATGTGKTKSRKPFTVVLSADADAKQRRQAAYLEQLMAVKMAKGEKDVVYLGKSMSYVDAKGKKRKAPGFSKSDLAKMTEGSEKKKPRRKRTKANSTAKNGHKDSSEESSNDIEEEGDENDDSVAIGDPINMDEGRTPPIGNSGPQNGDEDEGSEFDPGQ